MRSRLARVTIHALSGAILSALYVVPALAQDRGGEDIQKLQAIEVTGSRIKKAEIEGQTPVLTITSKDIEATGLGSIGDVIQRLSVSGSSLNTKFNSAGNFGFPPDGGGVGSGSTTISLRNLGAKRTLILVDGLRWVNESSASGVSAAVDLNTIPASAVDRIEILKDGASSLYGSDAIAGVINIITKKKQDGLGFHVYGGDYSTGDGNTWSGNISLGGSTDKFDFFMDISRFKQNRISSGDWDQSSFPVPGAGLAAGSSATPFSRIRFATPDGNEYGGLCPFNASLGTGFCNITANGAVPPGGVQSFPDGFHRFGTADRFNFAPYNLLLTPQDRTGIFAQGTYHITDHVNFTLKGLYNTRDSVNQAAPEPIFLGPDFCMERDLCYRVGIDATNPYNPFGFTLDPTTNFTGLGRRPIEGGPRVFKQTVDTKYYTAGLNGDFSFADHQFFWDVNYVNSSNDARQSITGTYNIRHIMNALGPVDQCTAPCVPLDVFGGPGTITPEMLNYIQFNENDHSTQDLEVWTANISGNLFQLPAGSLDIAAGYEHRKLDGSYTPDAVVTAGDSNGVPSGPTQGSYSVNEFYVEFNAPLLADVAFAKHLDLSVASRWSDYSNFGNTTNNKLGFRWQVVDDFTFRGTWAEGFRAPSIGELYGTFSRFDAQLIDPCAGNTGANCAALGVPPTYTEQPNPQISVITGGNPELKPETSKSVTLGAIYSPSWAENTGWSQKLDFELTYYRININDAITARDAQTQLDRCVATLDPLFCTGITRSSTGAISGFNNTLRNLGKVRTSGYDFGVNWSGPEFGFGHLGANWQLTYVKDYKSIDAVTGFAEPQGVGIEVKDSGIPKYRSTLSLNWALADWTAAWTLRYISDMTESCGGSDNGYRDFPTCSDPNAGPIVDSSGPSGRNHLGATTYHDVRVSWKLPVRYDMSISGGINNIFDKDAPICISCSLNGYDASNYDLPGRFTYIEASVKF
jgi:iron complex outermembrane receptor protein